MQRIVSVIIFGLLTGLYSCTENITDQPAGNLAPDTKLFLEPDGDISQQQSVIKLYWTGDDPDGLVMGFYFSWDNIHWTFTESNDSLFSLKIGAVDTVFAFKVSAVDNSGNGIYDTLIIQNGVDYGAEPFTDLNSNGIYNEGEPFTDIGAIDPSPAELMLPIKNSAPTLQWNALSYHPDTTFSAMSFGWDAQDIDGNSTISYINLALNDTTEYISIGGFVRRITLRTDDFTNPSPLMDILIDGDPNNPASDPFTGQTVKLPGVLYNAENKLFVQAVDISGAKSLWLSSETQDASSSYWYIKKPKGKFLIIDDYLLTDNAPDFYVKIMDSLGITGYDVYDIKKNKLPYLNTTFLETLKLFRCVIWYGDASHSADLASAVTQSYTGNNGKIIFSFQFPQTIDLEQIQGYIPILTDSSYYASQLLGGILLADTSHSGYPVLQTTKSLNRIRAFNVSTLSVIPIYYFWNHETAGYLGFENTDKNKFFIGIPLHLANGIPGSVTGLLNKIIFEDFNLTK